MKKFISTYKNPNEDRLNYGLINHEYDDDLVEYIINCCKSLEVLQHIKFIDYDYITNEADIDANEYINARTRTKNKKKEQKKYMYLTDSRYAELRLKFHLSCKGEEDIVTKKLLIPVPDEKGYYMVKGTQYFLMHQIVDNSTYTTKKTLTLKSMMPVSLKMRYETFKSTEDVEYTAPVYTMNLFRKDADIMMFYLAKMGLDETLRYFSVDQIINFTIFAEDTEKYIYFPISSKLFIEVNRHFFEKYVYVRTITFMLKTIMTNRLTMSSLCNKSYWVEVIGAMGSTNKNTQYEKGMNTLIFFDRIIDDTTKKILKIHPIHKQNIYSILRWMISNFNELRKKDNLDLGNKRLRCNEYIASLLTKAFSERVNRIISLGTKVTMKNIKEIFKFPGDLILQQLHRSGLLRYDDRVNDMDFFGKLRTTSKGPNSLGGNNENNIAAKYRGIDPSYIGRLDLNVCGTSDPGTSAILTPFCKTSGLYFDPKPEPQLFKYNFDKDVTDYINDDEDKMLVTPSFNSSDDYYDSLFKMQELNEQCSVKYNINPDKKYIIDINL